MPTEPERMTPKYAIGDRVFSARAGWLETKEPCPDCLGQKVWRAILPNGEDTAIPCPTCERGFQGCTGTVGTYKCEPVVNALTIGSVRMDTEEEKGPFSYMCVETGVGSGSIHYESSLFATRAEADEAVGPMVEEMERQRLHENARRRAHKKKDRPGSMLAFYQRNIRDARKTLAEAEKALADWKERIAPAAKAQGVQGE